MELTSDVTAGDWIAPRLGPFGGRVGSVVPRGFAAYTRVLHPVRDGNDSEARWADVCAITGRTPHALMQWSAITGVTHSQTGPTTSCTSEWPGSSPSEGSLDPPCLGRLCRVLAQHTEPGLDHYSALWEGWGWVVGGSVSITHGPHGETRHVMPGAYPAGSPRLRLPHRDHLMFAGAADPEPLFPDSPWAQSPNLFWPADHSWCVGTEIDFDSTLVGGSAEVVAAVLAEPGLEAWPVDVDDSLAHDGDRINQAGGTGPV